MNNNDNNDLIHIEDELIQERSLIVEFVKVTPYPNYEEMLEKLDNNIELLCEYGKQHHKCCKIIYENPTNKILIVEMGKKIYEMGGMQSLSTNHTIIKYFSPYWNSTNIRIKIQGRIIENYFQDVSSEWKD
jgi:hypothetical protein